MNQEKASATLFFDTRRKKDDETYPVKLNIYHTGDKRRYKTGVDLSEDDWKKVNSDKLRDERLKIIRRKLNLILENAEKKLDTLTDFTFDTFETEFFNKKKVKSSSLYDAFTAYADKLEEEDRIGTVQVYITARNSFNRFKPKAQIKDVTLEFLQKYEAGMIEDKASPSTIGIYLRHLRAIINIAIKDGLLHRDKYPFINYTIPTSRNVKKALPMDKIKNLLQYMPIDEIQAKAFDFWIFSYLCNGMNMKDICLLKWSDVDGDFLSFFRAKTIRTKKKDLRPIKVVITERAREIIAKYANKKRDGYLFPILSDGLTAKQLDERVHTFIKFVNKHMKVIKDDLSIKSSLTTYAARHSHATVLKRKGVSTEVISENLGHSSLLMTKEYLDDFTDESKKEFSNLLTDFL